MAIEEDEEIAIPEWVVTFGDMMSLLLTFFIMLVSMSEIKQEELYQAMVESMRRQFGHDATINALTPGRTKPRNAKLQSLATMGRARRANTMKGGAKVRAPVGDNPRVRSISVGGKTVTGGVIYFQEGKSDLTEEQRRQLQIAAHEIGGKPQKVEIRGHTSRKPVPPDAPYRDHWDLSYTRCHKVMEFLVEVGIDPHRIRLGVAASNEPKHLGVDPLEQKKNPRVEVLMLDERVINQEGKATKEEEGEANKQQEGKATKQQDGT